MAGVNAQCTACGAPVPIETSGAFAAAEVIGVFCAACTDQQFLDGGGSVLMLQRDLDAARFPLGKVTVTPGAVAALAESGQHAVTFLARHVRGDWGAFGDCDRIEMTEAELQRGWEATEEDAKINKSNLLQHRDRIMSEYLTIRGKRLWVITSLEQGGDTTVMLPEEY
jgi:hypothetical protein